MKRICYIIPSLNVGGTERQLIYLVRSLAKDYEITVVCTRESGALSGEAHRAGAKIEVLDTPSAWDPRIRRRVMHVLRERRPDIVHTFLFGFDWAANAAARRFGVPVIISSRRELPLWMKWRHIAMQKLANRYVDCVVANSEAVAQYAIKAEKAVPALFRVIYNGVDADAFCSQMDPHIIRERYRIPFHRRIIGIVANFSPVKDHEFFVEITKELLKRRADVHFLMVGTGPLLQKIRQRIITQSTPECYTRVSEFTEIADLYKLMDVSMLCSKVEGYPNALIESMSAGTPVVAPAVGGIPEIVRHGDTGRLVQTRDPKDFADEIEWVLNNEAESQTMAERASHFVRSALSVEKMVDAYQYLYDELLKKLAKRA